MRTIQRYSFFLLCFIIIFLYTISATSVASEHPGLDQRTMDELLLFYDLEELIIATGTPKPLKQVPSVASLITAADIERMGARTLDEVLETVPGLHVEYSGINVLSAIYSIRGIHTTFNPHVLLMINGIPLTSANTGGRPERYQLPVAMISRIEVVRGPGSTIYGADAFSGVINVITKEGKEIKGTEAGGRYGSFDTYDIWLQHGNTYGGWDLWAGFETQKSNGDPDRIVDQDFVHNTTNPLLPPANPALSNAPGPLDTSYKIYAANLGLRKGNFSTRFYGSIREDIGMAQGIGQALTEENDADFKEYIADMEYRDRDLTPDWDLGLRLHGAYLKSDTYYQTYPSDFLNLIGNPIYVTKYSGLETTAIYKGFDKHNVRTSAGLKFFDMNTEEYKNFALSSVPPSNWYGPVYNVTGTADIFMNSQNRSLRFLSLQDEWEIIESLFFTGGVRYDKYNDFGETINPRFALVWETLDDLTCKFLYGRAFRAPAFAEQYIQNNPVTRGNPDIESETIDTYELVFIYQPSTKFRNNLNLFYYEAENLIEYVGPAPSQTQNNGEQTGHGFEIEMDWQIADTWRLKADFAYQRSKNKVTKAIVADAPEKQFHLNPHWTFLPEWTLDTQFYWIAGRHRAQGDPRDDIKDYELVHLTLRRKHIFKNLELALAVRNLFDEDARSPSPYNATAPDGAFIPNDFPLEGRSFWVELGLNF